jgi:predicted  nucleic acid-binding Zn-ribbon protein
MDESAMDETIEGRRQMTEASDQSGVLQQLLALHEIDQRILEGERELRRCREELATLEENVLALEARLEKMETELAGARADARRSERAVEDKRATLDRLRSRVNQVQNERQYSAASLEFDLVRQDLRKLEDQVLEYMQRVEELENGRKEIVAALDEARAEAGPRREEIVNRVEKLDEELEIMRDRRHNLAIRIDSGALGLYDRIRAGRSHIAMAPLTEESVCGNCYTAVTIHQQMQIKRMASLVCCEGCGVILYPENLER